MVAAGLIVRSLTEYLGLRDAYEQSGRDGVAALIQQRVVRQGFFDTCICWSILAGAARGNLKRWPSTATAARGWTEFS